MLRRCGRPGGVAVRQAQGKEDGDKLLRPAAPTEYPNNLHGRDLAYFIAAPTLCYETNYPRCVLRSAVPFASRWGRARACARSRGRIPTLGGRVRRAGPPRSAGASWPSACSSCSSSPLSSTLSPSSTCCRCCKTPSRRSRAWSLSFSPRCDARGPWRACIWRGRRASRFRHVVSPLLLHSATAHSQAGRAEPVCVDLGLLRLLPPVPQHPRRAAALRRPPLLQGLVELHHRGARPPEHAIAPCRAHPANVFLLLRDFMCARGRRARSGRRGT